MYVMVRVEEAGCCAQLCRGSAPRDDEEDGCDANGVILPASETFGSLAHELNRRALVMHATLRRNESYGRVENDGGQDVWRAAWVGDLPGLRSRLDSHPLVAAATEPAGAGNTPLSAAAGHGRVSCVAELVHRLDCLNSDGFEGKRDAVNAALVRASEFGHASAAAYLLRECGADPGMIRRGGGGDGGNAFHAAAERGHADVLEALLEHIRRVPESPESHAALVARTPTGGPRRRRRRGGATPTPSAFSFKRFIPVQTETQFKRRSRRRRTLRTSAPSPSGGGTRTPFAPSSSAADGTRRERRSATSWPRRRRGGAGVRSPPSSSRGRR